MNPHEIEEAMKRMAVSSKPKKIAAILDALPLPVHIDEHFKSPNVSYLWDSQSRPCSSPSGLGNKHMGVWINERLDYIHIVFVTSDVLDYILSNRRNIKTDCP